MHVSVSHFLIIYQRKKERKKVLSFIVVRMYVYAHLSILHYYYITHWLRSIHALTGRIDTELPKYSQLRVIQDRVRSTVVRNDRRGKRARREHVRRAGSGVGFGGHWGCYCFYRLRVAVAGQEGFGADGVMVFRVRVDGKRRSWRTVCVYIY